MTVIVAVGFVAILVSIIMMAAAVNYKMKSVNVQSKRAFYTAEDVLDEINVGLQQIVSDSLSSAYSDIMADYNGESGLSAEERNYQVREAYYKNLTDVLCPAGDTSRYVIQPVSLDGLEVNAKVDVEKQGLYGLLRSAVRWDKDDYSGAFLRGGEDVSQANSIGGELCYCGKMEMHEESGIVLRGLRVYYQDPNGFISTIKTDIRLAYPSFAFSDGSDTDISSYAFITDTEYKAGSNSTKIVGKSYAYSMDTSGGSISFDKWDGGKDVHIVSTNLYAEKHGSITTNADSELWVGNIEAKSSTLNLFGDTYAYDDINATGRGSVINVGNAENRMARYVGYGDSFENSSHSSAILVNGVDTTINLSNARMFELYGRAFINGSSASKLDAADKNNDVPTGESIAIKSNQLMYLIPGKYLYVETDNSGTPIASLLGKNPITDSDLATITGKKYIEVSATDPVSGTNLTDYVTIKEDGTPKYEKVRLRGAGTEGVTYYYMTFKDEKAANDFFDAQFTASEGSDVRKTKEYAYGRYMGAYIKSISLPNNGLMLSAHAVKKDAVNGVVMYDVTDPERAKKNAFGSDSDSQALCEGYTNQFYSLTSALHTDYEGLEDSGLYNRSNAGKRVFPIYDIEKNSFVNEEGNAISAPSDAEDEDYCSYYTVYKNLINEDVLEVLSDIDLEDKGVKISKTDTTASGGDVHLVVCGGNVTVTGNFEGTIIAKGKIVVNGNYTLKAAPDLVDDCLIVETGDDVFTRVEDIFKSEGETAFMTASSSFGKSITGSDLVTYENWTKDAGF